MNHSVQQQIQTLLQIASTFKGQANFPEKQQESFASSDIHNQSRNHCSADKVKSGEQPSQRSTIKIEGIMKQQENAYQDVTLDKPAGRY